ncbi:helix-turn-helix domain-containing protein [Pseudonocardia sp. GCM10023141]|uniref:helix-turn-helix domain-containing protein n=1 Tax=Pseudonocardia sp. GCM10023141 TaxID=3252653 RepID=UPI0036237030
MEDIPSLGRNVRRIRHEHRLSLGALAQQAGLAKQTLANLENGNGNPTVETLLAVARALGIGVNWLMTEWGSPVLVRRGSDAEWEDDVAGRRRTLDQIYGTGQVTTALVELTSTREVRPAQPPGALHHAYVLTGEVLAGPVEDLHPLGPGDFIRFAGDVPHVLRAATDGGATVHVVTTVPKVQQFTPS